MHYHGVQKTLGRRVFLNEETEPWPNHLVMAGNYARELCVIPSRSRVIWTRFHFVMQKQGFVPESFVLDDCASLRASFNH